MAQKTTIEVLKDALKVIRAPSRWIKGAYAKNKRTETISLYRRVDGCYPESARCFCAVGAIRAVTCSNDVLERNARDALHSVISVRFHDVEAWNDSRRRTHAQVVAAFKKAIAKQKALAA